MGRFDCGSFRPNFWGESIRPILMGHFGRGLFQPGGGGGGGGGGGVLSSFLHMLAWTQHLMFGSKTVHRQDNSPTRF